MGTSILTSTKKNLGLAEDYTAFDSDVITFINGALATLTQLGVGPLEGFMIMDAVPTWETYLGTDPRLNQAKTFVFLQTKMLFDPPQTSFVLTALEKQLEELTWRINVMVDPAFTTEIVYDGGSA